MNWNKAKKILCIRLDYLGDVLMTTPALHAVKRTAPDCRITLLTSESGAAVAKFIPDVDDTIVYNAPWVKHCPGALPGADHAMIERLRAERFDAAIIFTVFSQNPLPAAMLCYLAGIPLRLAHCHENPYLLLTDWVPDPEPTQTVRHEVQRQLDLVALVGYTSENKRMHFTVTEKDALWVSRHLVLRGVANGCRWILLHPGATAPSRRYPPRHWAQAIGELARKIECTILFTGTQDESGLIDSIIQAVPHGSARMVSLAGELDLGQLGALIARAPLLVSNNTGPVHIASAVGTPVVDLYALTNPQHTPWMVRQRVLYNDVPCRFCFKSICPLGHNDCLTGVAPESVVQAVLDLLDADACPHHPVLLSRCSAPLPPTVHPKAIPYRSNP